MKYLKASIIFVFTLSVHFVAAQDNQVQQNASKPAFLEKIFVGGGFGAGFGDYTYINVSPIIGYRVTSRLSVGMRLMYQYTTFDYFDFQDQKTKTYNGNDFGIGGFARLTVYGPLYLQAEYEHLSYDELNYLGDKYRSSFDSYMAGGGLAQPLGQRAVLFMTAMYNFSYNNFNASNVYRVPYNSPWVFRVGVTAGF